jgi:hypothetical protein
MADENTGKFKSLAFTQAPSDDQIGSPNSYAFRNRVELRPDRRLAIESEKYEIGSNDSQEAVLLMPALLNDKISESSSLILSGSPYPDFDTAYNAGRRWRQTLSSALARMGHSCELGDDDKEKSNPHEITALHIKGMFGLDASHVVYQDRVGLLVFETMPSPRFINSSATGEVASSESQVKNALAAAQGRYNGIWPNQLRLAYELVHSSLRDTNPESRHILAVTAIEALIPFREKHPELSMLLDTLQPIVDGVSGFDDDTRTTVKRLLDTDKMESIRQYGRILAGRLADEYDSLPAKKYFDKAYGIRSDLAHGNLRNKPNLSKDALNQQYIELLLFVLDILEAWTAEPSFTTAEIGASSNYHARYRVFRLYRTVLMPRMFWRRNGKIVASAVVGARFDR